jgi:hypothetical protein
MTPVAGRESMLYTRGGSEVVYFNQWELRNQGTYEKLVFNYAHDDK